MTDFYRKHMHRLLAPLALPTLGLIVSASAQAQTFCVFDLVGAQGPLASAMRDYAAKAKGWGADITVRSYVAERVAAEDFKVGQCDAVLLTGIRARQFNAFTGSIDSIGGLPGYPQIKLLISTLARPDAAKLMIQGNYEVAGLLPLGACYIFLRDRRINSVAKMAGKKIAVLDNDRAQLVMAERMGAQAVASDVSTFAGKFNNGQVDVAAAPAVAYLPLEMYKGVGSQGVVVKMPVAQLTFQVVIHPEKFPAGFGQHSREYFLSLFDPTLKTIKSAEDDILFFFPPPEGDGPKYREMLRQSRISMTKLGIYDPKMMSLLKKVRCRIEPEQPECSDNLE
jgi:ABC-type amino acid transport substrate-binding protein